MKMYVGMDGIWKLCCTSTYIPSEVLALLRGASTNGSTLNPHGELPLSTTGQAYPAMEARFAGDGIVLVIEHSQQLKFWQGEIKVVEGDDEYEAEEDTGFEEENQEKVKKGDEDFGKISELPTLPSKPIVVRPQCTCFYSAPLPLSFSLSWISDAFGSSLLTPPLPPPSLSPFFLSPVRRRTPFETRSRASGGGESAGRL
jgi:hypothetical protein